MEIITIAAIVAQILITRIWQAALIVPVAAYLLFANQFAQVPLQKNLFFWGLTFCWSAVWLVWFEGKAKRVTEANPSPENKPQAKTQPKQPATPALPVEKPAWGAEVPAFIINIAQELSNLNSISGHYLASPKLDGIFARWVPGAGLYTKNGRRITSLGHIEQQLNQGATADQAIDGEIYSHGMAFEIINGLVRCQLAREEHTKLAFHAFDLPEYKGGHEQRQTQLANIIKPSEAVKLVPTQRIPAGQAGERYQQFINDGYEGIILRSTDSMAVYKHKPLKDAEARLIGFTDAKNDKQPFNAIVLQMPNGKTFKISSLKKQQRALLWQEGAKGQLITYTYQQLTAKGLPRFARLKGFRHDMSIRDYTCI